MTRGESRFSWSLGAGAVFAAILVLIAANPLQVNGDSAMYLQAGALLLDGRVPYAEIVDNNPPLIMYLSVLPAAVAAGTGAHPLPTFLLGVWLLAVASTYATRRLVAGAVPSHEAIYADLLALTLALASLAALVWHEFGQREHLFVAGFLPYLAVRFRTWEGIPTTRWQSLLAGSILGVVASLKPQFFLIVAAPELYWMATRRRWRPLFAPETLAALGAVVIYLAHFAFVPALMQREFFGRWLPFIAAGYDAYNQPLMPIITQSWPRWLPAFAAAAIFACRVDPARVGWRLARPLSSALIASGVVFVVQQKGWSYHAVPIAFLVAALAGVVTAALIGRMRPAESQPRTLLLSRRAQLIAAGGIALVAIGALAAIGPMKERRLHELVNEDPVAKVLVDHSAKGDPVMVISTTVWQIYPLLVQLDRIQATRFLYAFQIPVLYKNAVGVPRAVFPYADQRGETPADEAQFLDDLRSDLDRRQPKVVLIDSAGRCQACPMGFSVHGYLESNGFTTTALARYRRAEDSGAFATYLPASP